ncbi:MAG: TadE/TadG family type IV pilus assembly protein [Desulfuromonadales bacterium]
MNRPPRLHKQTGAAAVEFAIVLPLLLILLFGIIEFGFLWLQNTYIANAAREGARVASKSETTPEDVENAIQEYLKGIILYPDDKVETDCCGNDNFIEIVYNPEAEFSVDAAGTPVYTRQVTVTVQTAEIWDPILWGFLDSDGIDQISETAVFAKEDQTTP